MLLRPVLGRERGGSNAPGVVALTLVRLAPARSLRMDEWAAQWWSAPWRITSFQHTTYAHGSWVSSGIWTLQPPEPRLAIDRKKSGNSRCQVYHPRLPGGLFGGLLLVGDGSLGSGKSQRRGRGRRVYRSHPRSAVLLEVRCSSTALDICASAV